MEYLVYVSTAKRLMNEEELLDILTVARTQNKVHHITGMLLYSQGTFIQVLEGEKDNLSQLFKNIELDTRHKNVIKLMTGTINQRNFPDWLMAFASVNAETLQAFEGFLNPIDPSFLGSNDHVTANMLKIFAKANNLTY
ncbi:BLUF domain-containing protein [Mucilaginibacter flavus]|uniref:BLUF domain-containing protein n=1 Tax=Mucilaginibacter flavus TaxID=931504 RepID=UPI0025B454F5|nr:BLUF domain-containing protein [Mucilaginibacter flavus]MDN3582889.1 BLUF domain-containing protein [Mucilaginibacter flavus]